MEELREHHKHSLTQKHSFMELLDSHHRKQLAVGILLALI